MHKTNFQVELPKNYNLLLRSERKKFKQILINEVSQSRFTMCKTPKFKSGYDAETHRHFLQLCAYSPLYAGKGDYIPAYQICSAPKGVKRGPNIIRIVQ